MRETMASLLLGFGRQVLGAAAICNVEMCTLLALMLDLGC